MRALALLIVAAAASVPALTLAQAGGTSSPASAKAAEPDPDQRIRCRIVNVTGSLVKGGRVCRTVAEWRAIIDNNNENARKMVQDGTTRPAGN